jgi:hypothetical protein
VNASRLHRSALALVALTVAACGGGGGGGGSSTVVSFGIQATAPTNNQIQVSREVEVEVEFNEPLDPQSLFAAGADSRVHLRPLNGSDVASTLQLAAGDHLLVISPDVVLEAGTWFEVVLEEGIRDVSGRSLGRERAFRFQTVEDPSPGIRQPEDRDFQQTFEMTVGRSQHTGTLLDDGTVLLAGGFTDSTNVTHTAEIYTPATYSFDLTNAGLINARARHTATRLSDGRVLVTGGLTDGGNEALSTCEVYDPGDGTFKVTAAMHHRRAYHTATLLEDGRVLVCGGLYVDGGQNVYLDVAEIYDPTQGTWAEVEDLMVRDRAWHVVTRLEDGRLLLTGGAVDRAAEIFDPATLTFTRTAGDMLDNRSGHTAQLLDSGAVLVSGGSFDPDQLKGEIFFPATGTFEWTDSPMSIGRMHAAAVPVPGGGVVILGGMYYTAGNSIFFLASMDLFDPTQGTYGGYVQVANVMRDTRVASSVTALGDGGWLIAGGISVDASLPELRTATVFHMKD